MSSENSVDKLLMLYRSIVDKSGYERQKKHGFKARSDAPPVPIGLPIKWVNKDRNVEFNLSAWRFLSPIWGKLLISKDEACLHEAIKYIEDWKKFSENNKRWSIWYDMAVGIRAKNLAFIVDILSKGWFSLADEDKLLIDGVAKAHLAHLSDKGNITKGNHAVHQVIGLAYLAKALDDEAAIITANELLLGLVGKSFDANGFCTENSPFYHDYNIGLYAGIDLGVFGRASHEIKKVLKKAKDISPWLTDPDGNYFMLGDTEGQGKMLDGENCYINDDEAWQLLDLHESGYQAIRSHPEVESSGSTALVFTGTNKSHVHDHCDHLSFLLYHKGSMVLSDSGKFTYENDAWRRYFLSDKAHNTVGFKSFSYQPKDYVLNSVKIEPILSSEDGFTLSGRLYRSKYDFIHKRELKVSNDTRKIIIKDVVKSCNDDCYELRLHLCPRLSVDRVKRNVFSLFFKEEKIVSITLDDSAEFIGMECGSGVAEPDMGWHSSVYGTKVSSKVLYCHFSKKPGEQVWKSIIDLL